jgi:hypothetical protein
MTMLLIDGLELSAESYSLILELRYALSQLEDPRAWYVYGLPILKQMHTLEALSKAEREYNLKDIVGDLRAAIKTAEDDLAALLQ